MPTNININHTNLEQYFQPYGWYPSYSIKYKWYPIPPSTKPNELVKLSDKVVLYYTIQPKQPASTPRGYGYSSWATHDLEVYLSIDGGSTYLSGIQEWTFESKHTKQYKVFADVATKLKKAYLNQRAKERAKLTLEANKAEAVKLGISLQELKAQKGTVREKKIENSRTKRSVEEIQQLLELAKIITKMSTYIESIKQKMNEEDHDLNLSYFNRKVQKLGESITWLKDINTSKDKKKRR